MAYTAQDLADLDAIIASGVRDARYADSSGVTYRTQAELLDLRARMVADIAAGGGAQSARTTRTVRLSAIKGY